MSTLRRISLAVFLSFPPSCSGLLKVHFKRPVSGTPNITPVKKNAKKEVAVIISHQKTSHFEPHFVPDSSLRTLPPFPFHFFLTSRSLPPSLSFSLPLSPSPPPFLSRLSQTYPHSLTFPHRMAAFQLTRVDRSSKQIAFSRGL